MSDSGLLFFSALNNLYVYDFLNGYYLFRRPLQNVSSIKINQDDWLFCRQRNMLCVLTSEYVQVGSFDCE